MNSFTFMQGFALLLGMCGVVSVRMFLPAFLTALLLKLEPYWTWFKPESVSMAAESAPGWLLHPVTISVLGILAALEATAMRVPEIKEFLEEDFERYAKPVFAAIVAFGFLNAETAAGIEQAAESATRAGILSPVVLKALFFGGCTAWLCMLRHQMLRWFWDLDPDNSLGLQTIRNSLEESVCIGGVFLLLLTPVLAGILFFAILGVLLLLRKFRDQLELRNSHPCPACGEAAPNAGFICPCCGTEQPAPKQLSATGLATARELPEALYEEQKLRLRLVRRCPGCATPLKEKRNCQCCGTTVFPGQAPREFVGRVDRRAMVCFPLFLVLGVIPVIGFVLSAVLLRILLLRPYRRYFGFFGRLYQKTLARILWIILFIVLAILSLLPFSGLLYFMPFLCQYILSRRAFLKAVG